MGKIRKSGGYRGLRTFQIATVIYGVTYYFCARISPIGWIGRLSC